MINKILLRAIMAAAFRGTTAQESIMLVDAPQYTKYFWGDIKEIAGRPLKLIERSPYDGSCLCMCEKGLVDVDHRDIRRMNA